MDAKRVTLIVSDLHLGDGKDGDDFVSDKNQFGMFIHQQAATTEGRAGEIELAINGDFLEFVQVIPQVYTLNSSEQWCSQDESVAKVDCILDGHAEVFDELKQFQKNGNLVTIFAGNHDVDLYWPAVQDRIRKVAGANINFELGESEPGQKWYKRYANRLWISHGHLFESIDPANGFKNWADPILRTHSPPRLEMCPGTLFVTRFVNCLERKYPFADNLYPESELINILWREDRFSLKCVAWMFAQFGFDHPSTSLCSDGKPNIGRQLLNAVNVSPFLQDEILSIYRDVLHRPNMDAKQVMKKLDSEDAVAAFIERLIKTDGPWEKWLDILDSAEPSTLGVGASTGDTLTIIGNKKIDARKECIKVAKAAWQKGAQIVVLGHTHLPQKAEDGYRRYYNPGSWTHYVEADRVERLKLEDLKSEKCFQYRLNYVRIEEVGEENLLSECKCFDRFPPSDDEVASECN